MLNTKQQKKSNNNIRYSLGNNPPINPNITGKLIKKNRPVKDKLHKNLSQLPIGLLNDSKQNASLANIMLARPQSSLVASDISGSLSKSREKVDLNSFCKDKIKLKKISSKRNTLGIGESNIKMRRQSGASQSHKKWNNRSMEQDPSLIKMMMVQNRKKYNLSCGDMIETKSKGKQVVQKGGKKKSLLATSKNNAKTQSKKVIKKQGENIKKFKPLGMGGKSKGSTAIINANQNNTKPKKKQNKQNKKKYQRSKSKSKSKSKNKSKNKKINKTFVFAKDESDDQRSKCQQQYPINKYVNMKKKAKNSLNIKVGLDYNFSCINIASGSSAIFNENSNSMSVEQSNLNKKRPTIYDYEASDSINVDQIRYYQEHSPLKNKRAQEIHKSRRLRTQIIHQLQEEYPYLNSTQLNFLSSVVLIQRKWRESRLFKQLDRRRQIVTQYVVDELQISRENKRDLRISGDVSRLGEKVQLMSRTKIAQFELEDNKQQTIIKSRHQQIDPMDYETRKNSRKNEVIIYSESQSQNQQNQQSLNQQLTDRKPRTQNGHLIINYAWILSKQIFPQITYLQYRRNVLREEFEKTMTYITEQKLNRMITQKQFQNKKKSITLLYEKELSTLKKTKHDIKKGYLKYIDCINKVKQIKNGHDQTHKTNNKYGLRKVSSESNFLSTLYEKIFKFDKCMSEWSGGSQSIQMLTKKILIRKQYYKGDKKSERRSLSDLRSAARSSFQMLRSCREPDSNTVMVFQQSDKLAYLQSSERESKNGDRSQNQVHQIRQFKFSSEIFKIKQENDSQRKLQQRIQQKQPDFEEQPKINIRRGEKPNINTLSNSIPLVASSESVLARVEELVLIQLAKQLQRDIHSINPILMDMILINQPSISQFQGVEYEQFEQEQASPALQSLHRQFESMGSPRQMSVRRQYHFETQTQRIVVYLTQLILFIRQQNWVTDIIYNMNNNQTFQPLAYLKFLRDFEIPDDEYIPIISNQRFIQWETHYNNKLQLDQEHFGGGSSADSELIKQSQTIFHRCVFQVFLGQLQKNRPYGERGRPFPWEQKYSYLTTRQVMTDQLPQVLKKSINKIEQYLIYKCGLITQKIFIANEDQLQRAHEENQDRIIEMLQQDLIESNHQWYQVQEHSLEIKLQITFLIQEELLDQILKTIKILSP